MTATLQDGCCSPVAVIEPPPPRPDPRPEPPPEPVPDPLPNPPAPDPDGPSQHALPIRIEAPDAGSAAVLMQQAIGSFRPQLLEEEGRWAVLIHPDREPDQLILDAIELVESWLSQASLASATLQYDDRRYRINR